MRLLLSLLLVASAWSAQITIPDVCQGTVCLKNMVWKKGFSAHTLTGTLSSVKPIEAVNIRFSFKDSKRSGVAEVHLLDVVGPRNFTFKASNFKYDGIKWEDSSVQIAAVAIHGIAPMEKDGIICSFKSAGSRLKTTIKAQTGKDLVLDYSMLMLTAGENNMKLNGSSGKYIDLDKPRPNTLIPDGTTHSEEMIPIGAAKFTDGEWVESWILHDALSEREPKLIIPFVIDGKQQLEKIPLAVELSKVVGAANAAGKSN